MYVDGAENIHINNLYFIIGFHCLFLLASERIFDIFPAA